MTTTAQPEYISQYLAPLQENEIDLVAKVREILHSHGLHAQVTAAYDNHHHIREAQGKNEIVQRYWLNRYWNLQLLSCSQPSMEQRYCLIPNGSTADWVRLFKASIAPFCMTHSLPRVL